MAQPEEALASQPVIERARGMPLLRNWSADEAFDALRKASQHTNVKRHDVATVLVAVGSQAEPTPSDPTTVRCVLAEIRRSLLGRAFEVHAEAPE